MILPSSQKSSVIKPSQPKMAAVGDPHGGEIPMELNVIAVWCVPCRRASRINSDNRIAWKLELSTNDWYYPDSRKLKIFCCRAVKSKLYERGVLIGIYYRTFYRSIYWRMHYVSVQCSGKSWWADGRSYKRQKQKIRNRW